MNLWRLITFVLFLPQVTLAQKPGTISDTIQCKGSSDQTYALYLPKNYSSSTPAGLILFFDPAARGRMPVELYQKIADKYSMILACSNNSKNGSLVASVQAGNAVLTDLLTKFNIDKKFIITSGFSGGGRAAVEFATKNRTTVAGVIACGAAFSSPEAIKMERRMPFAEVIGQLDMNYQEALKASEYLKNIHNPASLTFFAGGHQWPPLDAYEDALAWHALRIRPDTDLKSDIVSGRMKRAQVQLDSGHLFEAHTALKSMLGAKPIDSLFAIMQKDKHTREQVNEVQRVNAAEVQKQQNFFYAYERHMAYAAPDSAYHPAFWKKFRRECEKMIEGDRYSKQSGLRLIDYGWRLCAEQHFVYMNEEAYRQAAMCARIWALMQPDNPNACVQAARGFAYQKRKPDTLDYLRQAVARGFKDQDGVRADPAFKELLSDADLRSVFK